VTKHTAALSLLCLALTLLVGAACAQAPNLLANPGFEDPAGWLQGWHLERVEPQGPLYHYHLRAGGGGHSDAVPHGGAHALEIYSANTRLRQTVRVEAGSYLFTVWTRNNGASIDPRLVVSLGSDTRRLSVLSDRYRLYHARFDIKTAGEVNLDLISTTLGIAIDDLVLRRLAPDEALPAEFMVLDLHPAGGERSQNVQTYLKGMKQWLNFTVTAVDPKRVRVPEITITVPAAVQLTGLNESLLNGWRPFSLQEAKVTVTPGKDDRGAPVTQYRFPCPRFVTGAESPVSFGGCFVSVPSKMESWVKLSLAQDGVPVTEETIRLVPLDPPARQRTPRLVKTLSYDVQDWKADLQGRLDTAPRQFQLMGLNVWSDYRGPGAKEPRAADAEQQVAAKAATEYGVKEFWPNYSQLLSGANEAGCWYWGSGPRTADDPDMYIVRADGSVDKDHFNMRYAAGRGRIFDETVLQALQRMMRQPEELKLPFRYSGFITDALEGLYVSYDSATLTDFAHKHGLDPAQVTPATVNGQYRKQWLAYNNALYAGVAARLAEALREVNPQIKMLNTAGTFGPAGTDDLPLPERMAWGRVYDYNMPQWYSLRYFGSLYSDFIMQGVGAQVYGKENGYPDVIPLLCNSMGVQTESLPCIRFKVMDLVTTSPVVKGIGYYIGTNAFADARWMAGISAVHTLLADVEDYYVSGRRADALVQCAKIPGGLRPIEGRDEAGNQTTLIPTVDTACRVHMLGRGGRRALVTLVSHSNQGAGEKLRLTLDLKGLGATPKSFLYDHLAGRKLPLTSTLTVDTSASGSLVILEITEVVPPR
jgi:hypothetical protein